MKKLVNFQFQRPEDSPGYVLWQLTMAWQRLIKQQLDPLDLTHTQFVLLAALAWLSRLQESVTQIDIANHSHTDRMMVSKVLRTLESKGLILRQEHATDTRAKVVTLTQAGEQLIQKAVQVVEAADGIFFSKLGNQLNPFLMQMLHLLPH
ncbi:MAG TPA: MarR family transcriptional regulator [Saprospiraceae bacterium]|nr:MarR family transcriptional regulator [Saprospiraceae bacterium]MCB9268549.1 MarR family transcriptional regulator [Lewinellaceae bacterium]HPG07688.1 MarR family transcriptional regulator [Saprospiraceae bacterium]HPR00073.1 MarR family transcriptional regulator [Saprospiraceae bacterium]HQU54908.1 MarR family transcriptional regulator [Saprospiraceae bacterium]